MATIEPRLIHLLNNSNTPELANVDLPPFNSLPLPESADRPLPPLERDLGHRSDKANVDWSDRVTSAHSVASEEGHHLQRRTDDGRHEGTYAGSADVYPMRMLLRESDTADSHSLARILDDAPDASDDACNKKRNRGLPTRDDYLQLPQPVKKQKPALHASVMPPIINGLHEPPPDAALFPPIASSSFNENDPNHFNMLREQNNRLEEMSSQQSQQSQQSPSEGDKAAGKGRKKATKPRRKWSEEETNHLLLGVSKHGVGKWTNILEDPDFRFNDRSAGDLKDRFRTCCPDELRGCKGEGKSATPPSTQKPKPKPKKGLHSENILHEEEETSPGGGMITPPTESDAPSKHKKTRAHRKKMQDLESLGIHAPFKKSLRRERRPFTDQEDRDILEGLDQYGPAWTKIQRDPRYHLSSRQPTDLRDRVRNKYPTIYQRIEKGAYQPKEGNRSGDIMEPSVTTSIDNSLKPSSQMNRTTSREELSRGPIQRTDVSDQNTSSQSVEVGESAAPQWLGGEMGIARLLLDDPR